MKLNFSSSILESLNLILNGFVYNNFNLVNSRWYIVKPMHLIQLILTKFILLNLRLRFFNLLGFFRKMRSYYRYFYHLKRKLLKPQRVSKFSTLLNIMKYKYIKLFEIDYKSLLIIVLPLSNSLIYYQYLFTL